MKTLLETLLKTLLMTLLMTLPTLTNDDTNSILTGDAKRKGNFSYGVKPGVHCAFGNILI